MILVVGGAGYIGSHMLKTLRYSGEPHLAFDNLERGHRAAVADSNLVVGDLRDPRQLRDLFAQHPEIDLVMHFAAYAYVGESVHEPAKYWANNVSGTLNLLTAMQEAGVNRFVFSSTCATFGEPETVPIESNQIQRPVNPYGETKLAVEKMLGDFDRGSAMCSVILRYFNVAGSDPEGIIGEDHRPEVHLIPNAIFAAMGRIPALKLFGTDYPTPDGTCVRDYIHVEDLCQAHLLAAKHLRAGGDTRRYNLGNGSGFSNLEVLTTVGEVVGKPVPYDRVDRRPGDPAQLVGSAAQIRADWNWEPKYPELRTMVEHAYRWFDAHPAGYG